MNMQQHRTIRLTRRGLTLVELLIAMVVLLVGIYTVAAGFPRMLYAIRGEGERTTMTRLAEQAMSRLSENAQGLPDAITGGGSVSSESFPEDLTAPHTVANALQDLIEVRGEKFIVPAPYAAPGAASGGWGIYVLGQGPAQCLDWAGGYPYVYMLVPLTEWSNDPDAPRDDVNWFYVNRNSGEITVPGSVVTSMGSETRTWTVSNAVVDYAWTYPPSSDAEPVVRYVHQEAPSDITPAGSRLVVKVHPAHLPGGIRMLPGQTRVWARVELSREAFGDNTPAPGRYVLDNRHGLTLAFHPADAGLALQVDYQLRTHLTAEDLDAQTAGETVTPRRTLLMIEDQVIESAPTRKDASGVEYGEIRLSVDGLDEQPLFTTDPAGTPLTDLSDPALVAQLPHVLAVDLVTGQVHEDGGTLAINAPGLSPALEDGYNDGVVAFPLQVDSGGTLVPADYIGHVWRFYYQTLDRNTIQVQKAPRYYVDSETARSYLEDYIGGQDEAVSLAEVDYRTYRLTHAAAPNDASREVGVIEFGQWLTGEVWSTAESSGGETVAVSYSYVPAPQQRRFVWGELHTVPAGGRSFTLNHASLTGQPIQVLAVNGVSARAKAWWLNVTGRQLTLDVESLFLANPASSVTTVQ